MLRRTQLAIRSAAIAAALWLAACSQMPAPAPAPERDARMAGVCAALGSAVMTHADGFKDPHWRRLGLLLMLAPLSLARYGLEVPFKDDPDYIDAIRSTKAALDAEPALPSSPAYSSRAAPCLEWAIAVSKSVEKRGSR
jgi:hypothetical protein